MKVFAPFTSSLNSHVLLGGLELVNDQVLESNLASQISDTVHQIFALAVNNVRDVLKLALGFVVLAPDLVDLGIL